MTAALMLGCWFVSPRYSSEVSPEVKLRRLRPCHTRVQVLCETIMRQPSFLATGNAISNVYGQMCGILLLLAEEWHGNAGVVQNLARV